jgi:hypothetical protein
LLEKRVEEKTMQLDELREAWRSQDTTPLHSVNSRLLQESLIREQASTERALRIEARFIYGMSTMVFAGLAFILVLMLYDDDPRTTLDFVIVTLGAAAASLWAGHLYYTRKKKALRERRFGASLRDEIARHLALMAYEASRVQRLSGSCCTHSRCSSL